MTARAPHRTTALIASLPRGVRLSLRPGVGYYRHPIEVEPPTDTSPDGRASDPRAARDSAVIAQLQRLLLYPAASLWYAAFVLGRRRNYQDSWILEDIFWPTLALGLLFLYVVAREKDNRIITLLTSWTTGLVAIIPALKYSQPYATTIDSSIHFLMTESLLTTGRVAANHTYEAIAAMHAWLAALGLTGGLSATQLIKYGPALTGMLLPLIVYWVTRRAGVPPRLARYSILASSLAGYPYFLPNGTGYALIPLVFLLAMIVIWDAGDTPATLRTALTPPILLGIVQLTLWHSTTPLQLPFLLLIAAFAPSVVAWTSGRRVDTYVSRSLLVLSVVALLVFVDYHILEEDRVAEVLRGEFIGLMLRQDEELTPPAVDRAFEIPPRDLGRAFLVLEGRKAILLLVSMAGLGALWLRRGQLERTLYYYLYFALITGTGGILFVLALVAGIPYSRFLVLPVALSPFFVGLFVWWLLEPHTVPLVGPVGRASRVLARLVGPAGKAAAGALVLLITVIWGIDYYSYQPLIPRVGSGPTEAAGEYVHWSHQVNTAYQHRMLEFAETHAGPERRFASDLNGQRQYRRYFGVAALIRRGLYVPLHRREPLDPDRVHLFLLHWPGEAGGLAERADYRSTWLIERLRARPGWNLVYDNGGSFILTIGENDDALPLLAGDQ